ncbi:hypothetical protein GCM10009548_50320 [Streptomyces malaysiensis subsp. malaysiensis]
MVVIDDGLHPKALDKPSSRKADHTGADHCDTLRRVGMAAMIHVLILLPGVVGLRS